MSKRKRWNSSRRHSAARQGCTKHSCCSYYIRFSTSYYRSFLFIQSFLEILSWEENTVRLFYGLKFVIRNSLVLNNIIDDLYLVETLKLRERPTADLHGTSLSFSFMLLVLRVKKKRLFWLIRPWNTSLPNESRMSRGLTGSADLLSTRSGYFSLRSAYSCKKMRYWWENFLVYVTPLVNDYS